MNQNDAVILLVEGDELVRASLQDMLRSAGYRTEVYDSLSEFMLQPAIPGVGCLLLDLFMPESPGLILLRTLQTSGFRLPIILLSNEPSVPLSIEAMKSGAADFLVKPLESALVLRAVEEAVSQSRVAHISHRELEVTQQRAALLTPREMEVFREVTAGYLNKQIAQHLGTAEKTIKVHRGRVMKKMEARSVVDLVRMAQKLGITSDTDSLKPTSSLGLVLSHGKGLSDGEVGASHLENSITRPAARNESSRAVPVWRDGEKPSGAGGRTRTDTTF